MEQITSVSTVQTPATVRVISLDGSSVPSYEMPNPDELAAGLAAIAAAEMADDVLNGACRVALSLPSVAGAAILRRDERGHPYVAYRPAGDPVPANRIARAIAALAGAPARNSRPAAIVELPPDLVVAPFVRGGAMIGALVLYGGEGRLPAATSVERLGAGAIAVTMFQTLERLLARDWLQQSVPREEHEHALGIARRLIRGALCGTETGYLLECATPRDVVLAVALARNGGMVDGIALTRRDITYLWLLAAGCSNRQIARELGLAESTVKNQLTVLFDKIGVRDRTQAVLYALAKGIVPRPIAYIHDDPAAPRRENG